MSCVETYLRKEDISDVSGIPFRAVTFLWEVPVHSFA